jgi:hypothetical protein
MAARRLLIVMLVLLGLSTLAAALVPQHSLRDNNTTGATATQPTPTTTPLAPPAERSLSAGIVVGGKKIPVVAGPVCRKGAPKCDPSIHVGDQISLRVLSRRGQAALAVPTFGLVGIASPNAPAFFNLLPREAGTIGILFTSTRKVAARIEVLSVKAATAESRQANKKRAARSRARGGSGRS